MQGLGKENDLYSEMRGYILAIIKSLKHQKKALFFKGHG